jgi:hypothetical protein
MLHMGFACNMLSALGRAPQIASATVAPTYPGPLPGGIKFMTIEYPENGPIAMFWSAGQRYATIAEFYAAVSAVFDDPSVTLPNPFDTQKQLTEGILGLTIIHSKEEAKDAIALITHQGEGTKQSPFEGGGPAGSDDDLAHYYKFAELFHQHKIRKNPDPQAPLPYDFKGDPIAVPGVNDIYPMADVPPGGFTQSFPFDTQYSQLLKQLQDAWREGHGDKSSTNLADAINNGMPNLTTAARALLSQKLPAPGGVGIVGPSFQFS